MAKSKTTQATKAANERTSGRPLKALDMEALAQADDCLLALAHPLRIRMSQLLLHDCYTVGELAENCGVLENVASEHLRRM